MDDLKKYNTKLVQDASTVKYIFVSKGKADIIKAVQYRYVQEFIGYPLYNLGFGNYDLATDKIRDDSNSNNGDMYPVFRTVLNTIPGFFELVPKAMLIVRGSDSTATFEKACRERCTRKCTDKCKKRNRRISAYRNYVDKNFDFLISDYIFYGLLDEQKIMEDYQLNKEYGAVFLRKR